jgi:plastocyanin
MSVDPVDDCTFWYTSEYLTVDGTFNWHTRIASFRFPSCSGAAPAANLSPTALTFSSQNIGTSSTAQSIILTNTGTALMTISGIAIAGANGGDFSQNNNCIPGGSPSGSLAPQASCTINVIFTPLLSGSRTATLVITDNAAGSPQTAALSGTGVGLRATATTISSAPNPSTYGQAVTFTATVTSSGVTPSGTVTFSDGGTALGSSTLNGSGQASFTTSTLRAGSHSIVATYNGNGQFASSSSQPLNQTVNTAATATSLTSSPNPSRRNQTVTFTAAVSSSAGTPSGTVSFYSGASLLGSSTLDVSGHASFQFTFNSAGTYSMTARYGGDGNFASSQSAVLSQRVKTH